MAAKKAMVHRRRFLKMYSLKFCDIWQNFDFHRILNNENFKMEVEQKNFVIHLIIIYNNYSPKWRWVVYILATDTEVNNRFSINSEIIEHKNYDF